MCLWVAWSWMSAGLQKIVRPPLGCCLVREFMEKCDLGPLEILKAQRLGVAAAFLGKYKGKGYIK